MLGEGRGFSQDETSHSSYLTTLQERLEADSGGLRVGRATLCQNYLAMLPLALYLNLNPTSGP